MYLFCFPLVCRLHRTYSLINIHFPMARNWDRQWDLQELNKGWLVILLIYFYYCRNGAGNLFPAGMSWNGVFLYYILISFFHEILLWTQMHKSLQGLGRLSHFTSQWMEYPTIRVILIKINKNKHLVNINVNLHALLHVDFFFFFSLFYVRFI